ncbi:MAG TPA: TRAM domain-containing protein [Gemmatimonadaceae bacterium]|jgi:23S rRNA (uracil1939-C5)-methyltransferase|nr:TRAM domain-containing protein [Gemmatimonadaceae bacterium]
MAQMVSLEIESIAAGGDGVGRNNGLVVFVPRTAPGDVVTARIAGKGTFARGSLRTITRPSSERIDPPCPHYTRDHCGGCQLQHVAYEWQLDAKQRIVRDSIERIGRRTIDLPSIDPSPDEWRYRTKLTLTLKRGSTGKWFAGLHKYDDPGRIFALVDCPITDRRVVAAWHDIMTQSELFPGSQSLRGSVRITAEGPVFTLIGGMRFSHSAQFFDSLPELAALWWENDEGMRRLLHDRRSRKSAAASFVQINAPVAERLRDFVVERVSAAAPKNVIDAYAGSGDTAILLSDRGVNVTAIEVDREASDFSRTRLPESSSVICARVEEVLEETLPADAVILNPPRAGVDARVTEILEGITERPRSIVYVSCNPATLARDLARLPSYTIQSVVAFDMFPQTAHVETVCELVPAA